MGRSSRLGSGGNAKARVYGENLPSARGAVRRAAEAAVRAQQPKKSARSVPRASYLLHFSLAFWRADADSLSSLIAGTQLRSQRPGVQVHTHAHTQMMEETLAVQNEWALVVVEIPLERSLDTNSIPDGHDSQLCLALSVVVDQIDIYFSDARRVCV